MRKLLIIILVPITFACTDKNKLPKGILPREKMQDVMWDMIRAGEFLNRFVFNRDTSVDHAAESLRWYAKIYQVHDISKSSFEKSYTYYKAHPLLMKSILDSLSKKAVPLKNLVPDTIIKSEPAQKRIPPAFENKRKINDSLRKRRILRKGV